jgi:ubiquinone biosynthesis protein COQ4
MISRLRPVQAASAMRRLLQDPNDTRQVFRLLSALSPRLPGGLRRRFLASAAGARLLERRPDLRARLRDRTALAALPERSLGREYLRFMDATRITADGLVDASEADDPHTGDEIDRFIGDRLRDAHDLWHAVTGYGGDLTGEAALLAFTLAQTRAPGIAVLVAIGYAIARDPDVRRLIVDAFARGIRSAWLPAVDWEALLAEDVDVVRARLRVGPPPAYEPFFATELPEGGLLAARAA